MEKIFNGAVAPKRYESPALSVIDVNVERCFASGNSDDYNAEPMSIEEFYECFGGQK